MSLIRTGAVPMGRSKATGGTERARFTLTWVDTSVSVMFQNVFQKWTSRFWVRRSNSVPLNSGSMAYFPEFSPKATRPIARVWRQGRMAGVNWMEEWTQDVFNQTN
uniref:Uncharacterized protein n=1 Tax=Takifugu rubripes TaxID=31033 RepID=A0A674ND04_TAKRU